LPGKNHKTIAAIAADSLLFSVTLMETSLQRVPENNKPDEFSSGFMVLAVRTVRFLFNSL
jgi:hypothetical protein